jgi:hypothetical protein
VVEVDDTILDVVLTLPEGRYIVIPTGEDAKLQVHTGRASIQAVHLAISTPERRCVCADTITVRMGGNRSSVQPILMMVDDTGMVDGLPVNELATAIMKRVKNYPYDIHGVAVIVNDGDFA